MRFTSGAYRSTISFKSLSLTSVCDGVLSATVAPVAEPILNYPVVLVFSVRNRGAKHADPNLCKHRSIVVIGDLLMIFRVGK